MTTITRTYDIPDTSDAAGFARLMDALRHYDPIEARLDEIAAGFATATPEARDELIAEAGELLAMDPHDCSHIDTEPVSDEQDERNSRPEPY